LWDVCCAATTPGHSNTITSRSMGRMSFIGPPEIVFNGGN
jgi:hypothetical protein